MENMIMIKNKISFKFIKRYLHYFIYPTICIQDFTILYEDWCINYFVIDKWRNLR